jgi:Mg-chelatase subunit ChlD
MMVLDLTSSMGREGRIEALQNASPTFVEVIEQLEGEDQIGMIGMTADPSTYDPAAKGHDGIPYASGLHPSSNHGVGVLEAVLDNNFSHLKNPELGADQLVAGKYRGGTGIGAAIGDASHYLTFGPEARQNARKIIVLMTDGEANRPTGNGAGYARTMASYAAGLDVTIYTISLGNSADVNLNEEIAEITRGTHFDATGIGATILTTRLEAAFRQAATAAKRAKLVQ